ncbi:phospholipid/cholesterol/gamma-HCH transport system substrate-binding protein [Vreelandella songnenensis]|uniref:Phospholipid/cholesterol/gamma-HCH transport system substrate-binding protein n=1 Tax=Vreelandella songnenensis TaxID=1176243 RepID=A0A2T0V624_9GAMM|nr:MlaD family protein [Halomonas songnenensis]PRY65518.1 phospholipid/cholesterol/gamma-HCH transport system substrate-binding protein [Halomonas songnenensis]
METRAHHVLIGLFTVITAVAALLFALWMSQAAGQRDYQAYRILFERSVSGLSEGSTVQYNGIEVGDVTELTLNPADPRQVIARIRVVEDAPVKIDTRAKLAFASITGSMSVQLYGGTPESPRLIDQTDEDAPFISADPSPIATLFEEGEELIKNVSAIMENVNELFNDDNREQAGNILTNVAQITEMIASQQQALDDNMALFGDVSRQATTTLESIDELSREANQLLKQDGQQVMQSAADASRDVARAAQRMEQLIEQNAGAVESTLQGTRDIAPALSALRSTLNTLDRITRQLEESPRDFLLGRDQVEEFRP